MREIRWKERVGTLASDSLRSGQSTIDDPRGYLIFIDHKLISTCEEARAALNHSAPRLEESRNLFFIPESLYPRSDLGLLISFASLSKETIHYSSRVHYPGDDGAASPGPGGKRERGSTRGVSFS